MCFVVSQKLMRQKLKRCFLCLRCRNGEAYLRLQVGSVSCWYFLLLRCQSLLAQLAASKAVRLSRQKARKQRGNSRSIDI